MNSNSNYIIILIIISIKIVVMGSVPCFHYRSGNRGRTRCDKAPTATRCQSIAHLTYYYMDG